MATNLIIPEKNNDLEGYEQPIDVVNDGIVAAGFYPQVSTTLDQVVGLERVSNEARLKSTTAGAILLNPIVRSVLAGNQVTDTAYTGGLKSSVAVWRTVTRATADRIYDLTITRTSGLISQTVEHEYDAAGTLNRTITTTYARTSGRVTLETVVVT